MAYNDSAAAACSKLHSIFDSAIPIANQPNSTASLSNASLPSSLSPVPTTSSSSTAFDWLSFVVTSVINPVFCGFGVLGNGIGVLGNLLTIVILCRRRMKAAMSCRIERASRAGLIGLAVADLLCSASALVVTYGRGDDSTGQPRAAFSEAEKTRVLSVVYGPFAQNACVKSNTWLTVVVAVGRYMVICHPLHARYLVSVTATRFAIVAAFIAAVLIELPGLWTFTVVPLVCPSADGKPAVRYFVLDHGQLVVDSRLKMTFDVISISLGFIVPIQYHWGSSP